MTKQKHIKAVDAASNAEELLPLEQMMVQGGAPNEGAAYAVDDANQDKDSEHHGTESKGASLVPKLRFAGFTESWRSVYLKDVVTSFEYGLNAPAKDYDFFTKYLRITDIDEDSRKFLITDLKSPDIEAAKASDYLAQDGDLFFARTASVGRTYLYSRSDGRVVFAGYLIRGHVRQDLFSPVFIFYSTLTTQYEMFVAATSARSVQPGINAAEYGSYQFAVPSIAEQQRIGSLFKELDHNIELNRGLLEKLTQLKKSMLEQMFPREGESLPRLRFAGFTEPWRKSDLGEISNTITEEAHNHPDLLPIEQTISQVCTTYEVAVRAVDDTHQFKDSEHQGIEGEGSSLLPKLPDGWKWVQLKDLGEIMTGTTPPMLSGRKLQGVLPLITPAEISGSFNGIEAKRWFLQENKAKAKTVPADTVLMVCIGSVGRCSLADREVGFNQQINAVIVDNSVASPAFVLAAFMSPLFKSQLSDKTNCTLIPILNLSTWGDLYVPLPSLAEQQRIGEFFKALDQRITQQRAKVEKLGHLKKALLEQMFV